MSGWPGGLGRLLQRRLTNRASERGARRIPRKRTVADIHPYCMGETSISTNPDGRFRKTMNGFKTDEQTKKSRSLDMASALQERSTTNRSTRKHVLDCILWCWCGYGGTIRGAETTFDPISLQIQLVAFVWGSNSQLRLLGSAAWHRWKLWAHVHSKL